MRRVEEKARDMNNDITGVYFLTLYKKVVYVGQSKNIRARIKTHFYENTKIFNGFNYLVCPSEELYSLEYEHIKCLKPRYNKSCKFETKDAILRIRIDEKEKSDLDEASLLNGVSSSEFARVAIKNRFKKALSNK